MKEIVHAIASRVGLAAFLLVPLIIGQTFGEVLRFEIVERLPFADGESFGDVGPYQRIIGKVVYAIDPNHGSNAAIIDLSLSPRDDQGRVRFESDLVILAPQDISEGNTALLYEVNNRGNKNALRFFNDAPGGNEANDAGNGFLMRYGFTVVWHGWDGELLPGGGRLRLSAPVAQGDEKPVAGLMRYEICPGKEAQKLPVNGGGHGAYRPTQEGLENATLSSRLRAADARVPIPRKQFRLHVSEVESTRQGQLPQVELELSGGFRQGYLYELIYQAQDPLVHGVCFASLRDLITALKHGEGGDNPLMVDGQSAIRFAYGFGVSQSGRFLREYLYSGFNQDEKRRQVFDGLIPHVAGAGLGCFNQRFAQPTAYATQHQLSDWPTDRFPFTYATQSDPLSNQQDGILRRAVASGTAPKVVHTQSSAEYWSRSGSLVHTDPLWRRDAEIPDQVRVFAFGGTQHGVSTGSPTKGSGQTLGNPADYRPFLRALLVGLDRWCRQDVPLPPSVYPTIRDGTLVGWRHEQSGFPALPGIRYPEVINEPNYLDFGKRWQDERVMDIQPPRKVGRYTVLVPNSGADGNDLGCLLLPEVAVPLGTYTGWKLRNREAGAENELVGLAGSFIPLLRTKAERVDSGDPRQSLEERYGNPDNYVQQVTANCKKLVQQRYLLEEDVPRIIMRQRQRATQAFDTPES